MSRILLILILSAISGSLYPAALPDPPLPPVLKNVTVNNASSSVRLTWLPSLSPGVAGYVVYRFRNNEGYAIDTVWNPETTFYDDYEGGALFFSEAYVVAAIDGEMNISPLSNSLATIFLTTRLDTCNNLIQFSWSPYNANGDGVTGYQILASESGADPVNIITTDNESLSATWMGYESGTSYSFVVKAVMNDNSESESNMVVLGTDIPRPPSWIETAGIFPSSGNRLTINVIYDQLSELNLFRIRRRELPGGTLSTAGIVVASDGSFTFEDLQSDAGKRYVYLADALNSCGNPAVTSDSACNVVLSGSMSGNSISLAWNPFTGWSDGVTSYEVQYRNDAGYATGYTVSGSDTSCVIDYRTIMYEITGDKTCFRIVAKGPQSTLSAYTVWSDAYCVATPEKVFVPTAFSPDGNGLNDSFGVTFPFTPGSFVMRIMDKSGRLLFTTERHDDWWDGTFRGNKLPPDVYLWHISFINPSGRKTEMRGTVALIYNN